MRILAFLLFLAAILCLTGSINAQTADTETGKPASELPQAEPVYNLLKAIEISDFDLFVSAFEPKSLEFAMNGRRKKDWPKVRKGWKKDFKEDLGNYRFEDLRFVVDRSLNNDVRSVVYIVYKGKLLHGMNVSKLTGKWKIIEL
jgi:hypothetical protein